MDLGIGPREHVGVTGEPCEACWALGSVISRPWVGVGHRVRRKMTTASTWLVTRSARVLERDRGQPIPRSCASNIQIAEHLFGEDRQKEKCGAQDSSPTLGKDIGQAGIGLVE